MTKAKKPKGWPGEPVRHSAARRGIKTSPAEWPKEYTIDGRLKRTVPEWVQEEVDIWAENEADELMGSGTERGELREELLESASVYEWEEQLVDMEASVSKSGASQAIDKAIGKAIDKAISQL